MTTRSLQALDKLSAGLAFLLGLASILLALASQVFGGLVPCELCLQQRLPYYIGLPILFLVLLTWNRLPLPAWYAAMAAVAGIFTWGAYLGGYHAGVEWGFWPGPTACTGVGETMDFSALNNLTPVIGCDTVQFRFLGISLAGYNALICLAVVALLIFSIWAQATGRKRV